MAAQGGDVWAAVDHLDSLLSAVPDVTALSPEQVELRRALGVL